MAAFYVKSGSGVTEFAQSTLYASGDRIVPKRTDTGTNYLVARRWVWECTTGGTTAAAEPTWPASVTVDVTTVTSNTAVFTARRPGFPTSAGAPDWTFATIYVQFLTGATSTGDTIYVSNNHSELWGEALVFVPGPVYVTCVNDGAAPPTTETTGAIVAVNGNFASTIGNSQSCSMRGIHFRGGVGSSATNSTGISGLRYENCTFELATTGASSVITMSSNCREVINCWVKFAAAGQNVNGLPARWSGGGLASGGTSPTNFLGAAFTNPTGGIVENLDLSAGSAGINICSNSGSQTNYRFRNFKMPASWSGAVNAATPQAFVYTMEAANIGTSGVNYQYTRKMSEGQIDEETTIVKASGANDGTRSLSWKAVSNTSPAYSNRRALALSEIVRWNDTTGSAITVSVDILRDSATNLQDKDVVLEVSYMSAADSPLGAMATSDPGFMATASDLAASTATWTTTGMSNPNKQKVSVTFTPQLAGYIHATVKLYKASTTVYVDPKLTVS